MKLYSSLEAPLLSLVKRVDFVRMVDRLSGFEPGRTYAKNSTLGPAFDDQEAIASLAVDLTARAFTERGDLINRQEIVSHVDLIRCRYDYALHQKAKATCFNLITQLFESPDQNHIFTSSDHRELEHLPALKKAQEEGLGIVYLINHSSHFDEFIFNTFIDQNGLGMPLFAAGQNMMVTPTLTSLFMLGSYVIVRKGASRAYLSSLFHYCQALAEMGKPQGIFLEAWSGGARTRDGSLRYPRRLVTIQGALAARADVFIQPVVISYSRVPEDLNLSEGRGLFSWLTGNHLMSSLLCRPWRPLAAMAQGLKGLFGRTYVGFARGRLLSELKTEWETTPKELAIDEYAALYAIKEIAQDKKIMSTQLAALALANAKGRDRDSLTAAWDQGIDTITNYHQRVFEKDPDFEDLIRKSPSDDALNDGLNSLARRSVISDKGPLWLKRPKIKCKHALAYYATHSDRRLYSPSAKENLVVCGAGPWGFSLVNLVGLRTISDKRFHNSSLSLYDPSEEAIQALAYDRTLEAYPETRLPKNVFPSFDHTEAFRKATEVIVATCPDYCGELFKTILNSSGQLRTLILASNGFDRLSHRLTIQMAWEAAVASGRPKLNILVLAGRLTPAELITERGGSFILAGPVTPGRSSEASLFKYKSFGVHLSDDPIGVQTAASLIEAYALYGALLHQNKGLKETRDKVEFIREISAEAKTLAVALGGQPSTFESDSPAWLPGLLSAFLTNTVHPTVKLALTKGTEALKEYLSEHPLDKIWPDQGAEGYYSIHSAYLIAKHLSLSLPHLEAAHKMFWES
ncbi:MAG: 1-acyl-sn-glycerol-3-phosphate acyltransferase [Deltaproteobacteria bacterium]|nr:1-acyl-sn-glycerol-3-phosphate acyltransferase [Deltaproteobacteria bacterium]